MTTLLFHIGDPKTGTSSIQTVLHRRLWSSPARTLAYPDQWKDRGLVGALKSEDEEDWADSFATRAAWLSTVTEDVAVISAETMAKVDPAALAEAIARHLPEHAATARVLAYVRPHAQRVLSAYAQQTKSGNSVKPMDAFHLKMLDKRSFFYTPRFGRWQEMFGDRFVLRPMLRERLKDGDVVADFLDIALDGAAFSLDRRVEANTALSVRQLAALREVQVVLRNADVGTKLRVFTGGELGRVLNADTPAQGEKVRMHRALVETVRAAYLDDARALDARFFDGSPMETAFDQALAAAVPEPQSHLLSDHVGAAELAAFRAAAAALAQALLGTGPGWKQARLRARGHIAADHGRGGRKTEAVARVQARFDEIRDRIDALAGDQVPAG